MTSSRTARFAAAYALLRVGADVGDHLVQTDHCARTKGATDAAPVTGDDGTVHGTTAGRRACAIHCLTYSATQAGALLLGARALGLRLRPGQVAAALAVSGLTHYAIDRRVPNGLLQRFAEATGKGNFYRLADHGMNGAYCMDGAVHHAFETVAAAVLARCQPLTSTCQTRKESLMSTSTTWTVAWPEGVLARYLTVGGAHVDLMTRRFRTNYTAQGRPYVSDRWYEVDGFTWTCRGCDTRGSVNAFGDPYLPSERNKAHEDANGHAAACRSMARPGH